jgi:hypothetical protein
MHRVWNECEQVAAVRLANVGFSSSALIALEAKVYVAPRFGQGTNLGNGLDDHGLSPLSASKQVADAKVSLT